MPVIKKGRDAGLTNKHLPHAVVLLRDQSNCSLVLRLMSQDVMQAVVLTWVGMQTCQLALWRACLQNSHAVNCASKLGQ